MKKKQKQISPIQYYMYKWKTSTQIYIIQTSKATKEKHHYIPAETHRTTNNINIEIKQRNNNHQRKLQSNPAQIDANYSQ